ncbi:MBL fold metallo-hydrolase [Trichlorobacter lovleyi]|jgi:Metal-dependent hydrolases of the beta-lactamase superfamily I|uniref:Beta-lactamase domain protein n=1 Tax=Trichlorobacter lovleyi (strain ATCC BAA-1151 / DSM 17278 / SZ) TaxID=398767 RepID=B3E701_TRIL1|nr:MBL fold metallo-hydrolase [Trichlorobacter lovleyi]ACD96406.1 beta-lactamase domain protein [Trichlorobacter lovleyi SZ]
MKICSLASGSKGNCLFIETGGVRLLIDAGLSLKEITTRLTDSALDPESIHAVLVTHEHIDHIRSAGSFARRYKVPVLVSYATRQAAERYLQKTQLVEFETGYSFSFRNIMIDPFPVSHDCCDPVGFVLESREGRTGSATDLGIVTRLVREKLKGCRTLNLESNHDPEMLLNGPYPWNLKQRIKSRHGHLSNQESLELLHDLAHEGLEALVMAHLSEVNNHPDKVVETTTAFLRDQNCCAPQIVIGDQYQAGPVIEL